MDSVFFVSGGISEARNGNYITIPRRCLPLPPQNANLGQ